MNRFLDCALLEDGLPEPLFGGLIGICLTCPDDGIHKSAEAAADLYLGRSMAFPAGGLFDLQRRGIIEVAFGHRWYAILRVSRGRLRAPNHLVRPAIPRKLRDRVFLRDGARCAYCGAVGGPFDIDHIIPWSRGGSNEPSNLTVACVPCNRSKSDRTPAEWLQ